MRAWILTATLIHSLIGLGLGLLGAGIFVGWLTAFEGMALYLLLLAGLTSLGQMLVLRHLGHRAGPWAMATAVAIIAGILLPEWLLPTSPTMQDIDLRGTFAQTVFLGLVCGVAQWAVASPRPQAFRWIGLSVVGWTLLLVTITAGAHLVIRQCLLPVPGTNDWPLWAGLAVACACGALGGAAYGAFTAPALPRAAR